MEQQNNGRGDQEMVRALSHPVRVKILEALQDRVASPRELSREMDRAVGVISYHAHTLVRCGCLELVETVPRQGSLEHYFTLTPSSLAAREEWRRAPEPIAADAATGSALQTLRQLASRALIGASRLLSRARPRRAAG